MRKNTLVVLPLFFFLVPTMVSAATLSLQATPTNIGLEDTARVTVLLDSDIPANAFSGTLLYPATMLEPIAVSDGSSIISLWITHPVSSRGESIVFAGITPGGFSGRGGVLFSVLFRAKKAGTAGISLGNIEILRNDGEGGKESVTTQPLMLRIGPISSGGYSEPTDHDPPESFSAYVGNEPQFFSGRNYLVFSTVDKLSGVDQYLVAESRLPPWLFPLSWHEAVSPYVLTDQGLTSTVYVKAVDRAGNERLSIYPPRRLLTVYEMFALLVILSLVALLWKVLFRRRPGRSP